MAELEVDTESVTRSVREGTYFKEALRWYSEIHHTPMAERSYIAVAMVVALLIMSVSLLALYEILPISRPIPYPLIARDNIDKTLSIVPLAREGETANVAVRRFLVGNYVRQRESYSVEALAGVFNGVKTASTDEVFAEYRTFMNPQNPASPISRYERHTERKIAIISTRISTKQEPARAQVVFEATEKSQVSLKTARFVADIAFSYKPIEVNQETGELTPMEFKVSGYNVKEESGNAP